MTTLWPSPKILAFNVLTRNVPIPDEVKKFNSIFISIQLSEMNGSLRVKIEMFCAVWYNLYNLKYVKNTHGGVLLLVKLLAVFYFF